MGFLNRIFPLCYPLPNPIPLKNDQGEQLGMIDSQPHSFLPEVPSNPHSLTASLSLASSKPVYFIPHWSERSYCSYPVHLSKADALAPENIFSQEILPLPDLFGKPTLLQQDKEIDWRNGTLYNPENETFYAPDVHGLKWFLVGKEDSFRLFWSAIYKTPEIIHAFSKNPEALLTETPSNHFKPNFSSEEAASFIYLFATWLQENKPALFSKLQGTFSYSPKAGWEDTCSTDPAALVAQVYAYYNVSDDRVYFMPLSIQKIKDGEYEGLAGIIEHELKHQSNSRRGFAHPSIEIFQRGMSLYLEDMPFPAFMEAHLSNFLSCHFLSEIYEEEMSAYSTALQDPPYSSEISCQSLQYISHFHEGFGRLLPWEWLGLSLYYVMLSREPEESTNLFIEDFDSRIQCRYNETDSCQQPSEAWKILKHQASLSLGGKTCETWE